jgi:hypothetical protein
MMRALALSSVVVAAWAASAHADDSLAQARAAVKASDYPGARSALAAAVAAGHASPSGLAELYELSGIVEAALGNNKGATVAFVHWLVLDKNAMLPPGTSPKIVRPFDAARTQAATLPVVAIDVKTTADPPQVAIAVAADPLHMLYRARVYVAADDQPEHVLEDELTEGRVAIELPPAKRLAVRIAMLDQHGNHAVEQGTEDAPIIVIGPESTTPTPNVKVKVAVAATAPSPPPPPPAAPLYRQPWLWTAVGAVGLGGASIGFGVAASSAAAELRQLNATSSQHLFSQAQAVQARGDRDAVLCNAGFIAAGGAALAATVLYLIEHHGHRRSELHVGGAVSHGGATLAIGGAW